jgi:fermentation-respiration switch protein FrsA (DUF1100 family)
MFLMNYLVDFNTLTGTFTGDRQTPPGGGPSRGPLFTSVNWLKLTPTAGTPEPNPLGPGFNPEPAVWVDLGDMDSGTILVGSSPAGVVDEGNTGVRIGLDPDSPGTAALTAVPPILTISVCFGRPARVAQKRASPFFTPAGAAPANQIVLTTFVKTFNAGAAGAPTGADSLGNPTWFLPIDLIRFRPVGSKHRTHTYEFSVGVIVTRGAVAHHYSHDPQMDVGL